MAYRQTLNTDSVGEQIGDAAENVKSKAQEVINDPKGALEKAKPS